MREFQLHFEKVADREHEQVALAERLHGEAPRDVEDELLVPDQVIVLALVAFRDEVLVQSYVHVPKVVTLFNDHVSLVVKSGQYIARRTLHKKVN